MATPETTYQDLRTRLVQAEEILEAIRTLQIDAIVGNDRVVLLRLQETEETLRQAQQELKHQVEQQLAELAVANATLRSEIAERKQIEESLQRSKELFSAFMDNSPAVAFIKDAEGRYLYVNKHFTELMDLSFSELLGTTDVELWPPEIAQQLREHDALVLANNKSNEIEETTQHKGSIRHWLSFKFPLLNASGQRHIAGVAIDISARKAAEESLHFLSKVFQDAADPILIKDLSGRIIEINMEVERSYGWTREELVGQSVKILTPPERYAQTEELIERCKRGEEVRNVEGVRWTKTRQRLPVLLTLSLLTNTQGYPQAIATIAKDISALKQAEANLHKQTTLATIGTTVAKLAHEIGNPLNGMYTTAQLLERHVAQRYGQTDDVLLSTVQDLKSETNRLRFLLHELRSLRPTKLQLQPLSLTTLAMDLLATEAAYYTECGVRVEQDFPADLPPVIADGERVKQVLLNLCKNAVEAMPKGGTLTVRGYASDKQVSIEVQDTGGGVPNDIDIFEPFVSTKPEGTGLGLAIVQQIVADHKGTLRCASILGQGTTFTLVFPTTLSNQEQDVE